MPSNIKIYKINDFIRLNESGNMDLDRTIEIVKEVAAAASFHSDHNILIDLRETTLLVYGMMTSSCCASGKPILDSPMKN